jgi:serpin B
MMRQAERFPYAEGAGYQAVQLPYDEYDANMLIILPDEGAFGEVEERLGADLLDELNTRLSDHRVGLTMPRFDFEEELKLIDLMKGLGLRLPFDPYGADFSGVTKKERLYIYEALHKATITVDEKGTEAAAATAVLDMPVSSVGPPVTVTLDRPFIFAIQERQTGVILFLGRVTSPQG